MMETLTRKQIVPYELLVSENENYNPFPDLTEKYGEYVVSKDDLQKLFILLYGQTPVLNDADLVKDLIWSVFILNKNKYDLLFKTVQADYSPTDDYGMNETQERTGVDTTTTGNTRTNNLTDTNTPATTLTAQANSYDNATLRDVSKTIAGGTDSTSRTGTVTDEGGGSIEYGNTLEINRTGYYQNPSTNIERFRKTAAFSFMKVMLTDVMTAISCGIYP